MKQNEITAGCKYIHKTKKTIELVLAIGKVKIDGIWHESVVYEGRDYKTNKSCIFTRTLKDFCENFEKFDDNF